MDKYVNYETSKPKKDKSVRGARIGIDTAFYLFSCKHCGAENGIKGSLKCMRCGREQNKSFMEE